MVSSKFIFVVRCVLALVWLYNGLWEKIIAVDTHHLEIVQAVTSTLPRIGPVLVLRTIGGCETLLAVGIISGLFHRFVSWFQIIVLFTMNMIGILCGGSSIHNPSGLLIMNLPIIMCALMVAYYGPGSYALRIGKGS